MALNIRPEEWIIPPRRLPARMFAWVSQVYLARGDIVVPIWAGLYPAQSTAQYLVVPKPVLWLLEARDAACWSWAMFCLDHGLVEEGAWPWPRWLRWGWK